MIDWDSLKDLLTINGIAYPIVREAFNYVKFRRRSNDLIATNQAQLEASVRNDLWTELGNLRVAVGEAQKTLIEWQSKYFELLSKHTDLSKELVEAEKNFVKVGNLLSDALRALAKIEEVERAIDAPDLDEARNQIEVMKLATITIQEKASILHQI